MLRLIVVSFFILKIFNGIQADQPMQYAAVLRRFGPPEKFTIENGWEIPEDYGDNECWLLVKSAAVYPWDKHARLNNGTRKRLKAPVVIGQDVSGIVIACGDNVTHIKQAQRVFAKMPNYEGGYKQIVLTKGYETQPLPENMTHEEGALIYYPYVTAHKGLVHQAKISEGKSVFIIGGNRDVGRAAIQIAKTYKCFPIVASTGTEEGLKDLYDAGATHVVNHNHENFQTTALAMNHFEKFDVVLNNEFPENHEKDKAVVKEIGGHLLYHDLKDIERETHGIQPDQKALDNLNASMEHIVQGLHSGIYRPHINKTFYLDEIAKAHREVANKSVHGDIVLTQVHNDAYIHLTNCEFHGKPDAPRPMTIYPTLNFTPTTPNVRFGNYRFKENAEYNSSDEMRSVSQYLFTLACEDLYGGQTPPTSAELLTYSFESYQDKNLNLSSESQMDADSVSKFMSQKNISEDEKKKRKKRNIETYKLRDNYYDY